ncbi:MAG: DNA topoisomerase IV subunit A [Defluviitaleaceae bacterium]|nr:DNA topoisomerase IV subunit A [Defluviitaleaceae bacterium]
MSENIQKMRLEDIMGERFGRYSKYIIQERALPDARDGLKPVQRRILYTMYKDGNTFEKAYRKSAKTVGNVMGNLHPHGDSSIYEAMVRMSQDFKLKERLIDMHGNNGSIDGDPAASMRYTEARLSELASQLLKDIDKDLVEHIPNFDDTIKEPTVLPAFFPNLLINGATGISAGYATDIPPHNLEEVIDAVIYAMNHPKYKLSHLLTHIKGPDFPTGAIIQGKAEIEKAYRTGKGRIIIRSKTAIEAINGGRQQIVVTEIPYEVNKANLVKKIDELRIDKKAPGIAEVRDETDRNELRIVIELKKDTHAETVLKYLLKTTDLQVSYSINMVAIHNKRPVLMSLPMLVEAYISHQKNVVTNRTNFDLRRAKKRQHIVAGLIRMVSVIDEVVEIIRASQDKADSKKNLMAKFDFTEEQVEAIVTLQLYRLSNTDITALQAEDAQLTTLIAQLMKILGSEKLLIDQIERELKAIKKQFTTARQTIIQDQIEEIKIDDAALIQKEDVMIAVTRDGYVKRTSLRSYVASKVSDPMMKEGDVLIGKFQSNTLNKVLAFTQSGHYVLLPIHKLPDIKWKDIGAHLSSLLNLDSSDKILAAFIVDSFQSDHEFLLATANGMIKRTSLADFEAARFTKKMTAMAVTGDDVVVNVEKSEVSYKDDQVLMITEKGVGLKYLKADITPSGTKTKGVKAITLDVDDQVVKAVLCRPKDEVHLLMDNGKIKKLKKNSLDLSKRAKQGTLLLPTTRRAVTAYVLGDDDLGIEADQSGQTGLL